MDESRLLANETLTLTSTLWQVMDENRLFANETLTLTITFTFP